MLDTHAAHEARQHGLDPETIEDFNMETMRVVFKDGQERQLTEVITRCMGYHRPVNFWNIGKRAEHAARKQFTESQAMKHVMLESEP